MACKASDPSLEFDPLRCLSNPGCYFDHELAFRRQLVSGALAGVPVCHLAIRNNNFQRLANDYVSRVRLHGINLVIFVFSNFRDKNIINLS